MSPLDEKKFSLENFDFKDKKVTHRPSQKSIVFADLIKKAYLNRLSLGEYAHFKTEGLGFDKKRSLGTAFNYFTNGVAVSEVQVDTWTGEYKVLRTDILMDLGAPSESRHRSRSSHRSLYSRYGLGHFGKTFLQQRGKLLSHSPTTYKIPNVQDTPRQFNIDFIENNENHQNVHRSKAVGEPPFLLGISVWTALKDALKYRKRTLPQNQITSHAGRNFDGAFTP